MIRNLVFKFPSFRCTSDCAFSSTSAYRQRSFRSLSPIQKSHLETNAVKKERPLSCSRAGRNHAGASRNLCYSNEFYGSPNRPHKPGEEVKWRESTPAPQSLAEEAPVEAKKESTEYDTLEQYELEAARPRPEKGRDILQAFNEKEHVPYQHLQPNQIKPYGSQDNFYSPMLIRPTNSLNYPRKFKKNVSKDEEGSSRRQYSTASSRNLDELLKLSTTKSCIMKVGHSSKENKEESLSKLHNIKFPVEEHKRLEFSPNRFKGSIVHDYEMEDFFKTPSSRMQRQRNEEENRKGAQQYKPSYSDLIKLKLKERSEAGLVNEATTRATKDNLYTSYFHKNASKKDNKMLDVFKTLPGRRSLTTKSKSNLNLSDEAISLQRSYSRVSSKSNKCEDVCSAERKAHKKKHSRRRFPLEPERCVNEENAAPKVVYLPSKIRLPSVPHCNAIPPYRDCKKVEKCTYRADQCLVIEPKTLPKIPLGDCVCVDTPGPTESPKLKRLRFKFEDTPRVVCHPPPCQTPRADDLNPRKVKPLKPYVPKDCECVDPRPMIDVKLKRLPKCEDEEICRPPRICPIDDHCPPRADECLKMGPKKLPLMPPSNCPCIDIAPPFEAPSLERLNLFVPDPKRPPCSPPPCSAKQRADDNMKVKRKRLPKMVPKDCPCEDRPMIDWNLKRLVCEDDPQDCVVPDPCTAFPRADWGCWEYQQEECKEVEERCIDKRDKCAKPKPKPCRKKSGCEMGAGLLDYRNVHKRKFSQSSSKSSLKLYQQMKTLTSTAKNPTNQTIEMAPAKPKSSRKKREKTSSKGPLQFIKALNDLDTPNQKGDLLFKPPKQDRLDINNILDAIASTTAELEKMRAIQATTMSTSKTMKKPKQPTLRVSSRAISTKGSDANDEKKMRKDKECKAKQKCKNIKPSIKSMMCQRACPKYHVCGSPKQEFRSGCKTERVPVCCEKNESPYSAYTDNLDETIKPFTTKTPQFTCERQQYGFFPRYKKEHDPLDGERGKNKKNFSTSPRTKSLPLSEGLTAKESIITNQFQRSGSETLPHRMSRHLSTTNSAYRAPLQKDFLKASTSHFSIPQSRTLATKIFQIKFPVACKKVKDQTEECPEPDKARSGNSAPQIVCETLDTSCERTEPNRLNCKRQYTGKCGRKTPPFPAFSDCLDEEMEDILTECPLDKEKYLRMQPRFMNPSPKPCCLLKPPPPIQGKIDVLKEQECLREKFCLENEGVTQTCTDFGKPVPLMKTKQMVVEEKWDCKRIEELKKIGRWPPFTLKSNRRYLTTSAFGLNIIGDVLQVQGVCMRNYHVLTTRKTEKGKDKGLEVLEPLKTGKNISRRASRNYTTYKTKSRSLNFRIVARKFSHGLRNRIFFRTKRRYHRKNEANSGIISEGRRCRVKSNCQKFTLKNCPAKVEKKKCNKLPVDSDCSKPFSPYPAFSECKDHEIIEPSCECVYDREKMLDLQPRFSVLNEPADILKDFPSQERINRAKGVEYNKCKRGVPKRGVTIECGDVVEMVVQDHKQEYSCCSQMPKNQNEQDPCKEDKKKLEDLCMKECLKTIPCHLPEEEKYCICQKRCKALIDREEECKSEPQREEVEDCIQAPKIDCSKELKNVECIKETKKEVCPGPSECKKPPPAPCKLKKSKSLTQLEGIWQKIVNYFKARPNCPQPGDYKKKVLKERAEKAAKAAGLVVLDPKCLPEDIIKAAQSPKRDCKVCPNQRSSSPSNKRSFSTNFQPSRNYSKSMSCKNLEEINRMLEEEEVRKQDHAKKEFSQFPERKDADLSQALKMSLDKQLRKSVDMSDLCCRNAKYPNTYFGYSNTIPSRENILERAWRMSIEAYSKYNYPRTYNIFNEIFKRVEKSVKTVEDLEKLKTETVLRELDDFLKCEDSTNAKKKK